MGVIKLVLLMCVFNRCLNYHYLYLYLFIIGFISIIYHFLNSNFQDKSLFIIKYFGIFLIYLFTFNSLSKLFNSLSKLFY